MQHTALTAALGALALCAVAAPAQAAAANPARSLGTDTQFLQSYSEPGESTLLAGTSANCKMPLLCKHGSLIVTRVKANGSLARRFGAHGGVSRTPLHRSQLQVNGLAEDQAGSIYLTTLESGKASTLSKLVKLTHSGKLDASFGDDGRVLLAGMAPTDVGVDSQGRVLVATTVGNPGPKAAVARYLPDGTPDPDFGVDGLATVANGPYLAKSTGQLALRPDDSVMVSINGDVSPGSGLEVASFTKQGTPSPGFGVGGVAELDSPPDDVPAYLGLAALLLSPNGNTYVVSSQTDDPAGAGCPQTRITRLLADGTPDPGFRGDGSLYESFTGPVGCIRPSGAVLDSHGRLLISAETAGYRPNHNAGVLRLHADGRLDRSFGKRGTAILRFKRSPVDTETVALGKKGGVIIAGSVHADRCRKSKKGKVRPCQAGFAVSFRRGGKPDSRFGPRQDGKLTLPTVLAPK